MKIAKFVGLSLVATMLLIVVEYATTAALVHDWRGVSLGWEQLVVGVGTVGLCYVLFRNRTGSFLGGLIGGVCGFLVAYFAALVWTFYGPYTSMPGLVWLVVWPIGSVAGAYLALDNRQSVTNK